METELRIYQDTYLNMSCSVVPNGKVETVNTRSQIRNLFQTNDISQDIFWPQKIYFEISVAEVTGVEM